MDLIEWERLFEQKMIQVLEKDLDPAHDLFHVKRVVKMAKKISLQEKARLEIVIPSVWLHDFVNIAKDDPRRKIASTLCAEQAEIYLKEIKYPQQYLPDIYHCIEAHSYSSGITPTTLEAQIVQDSDRLDSLGALGIARCFIVAGRMNRRIYNPDDPFCEFRKFDDSKFTMDHFYRKILNLADGMNTEFAKKEGQRRQQIILNFIESLRAEIY